MRGPLVLMALTACSAVEVPVTVPPVSKGTVKIRSFTEPSAVQELRSVGGYVFVVTGRGVERWGRDGTVAELSTRTGLASDDVMATAVDAERKALWILTPGSIGRYSTQTEIFTTLDVPVEDVELNLDALLPSDRTALAAADDGGVWIGTPQGLHYGSAEGWASTAIKEPVLALADGLDGLVVATARGLLLRGPGGEFTPIGAEQGCLVTRVEHALVVPKLGGTLVIGRDDRGAPRLAIGRGMEWHSFRVLPGMGFENASVDGTGGSVLLMGGGQLFRLTTRDQVEPQPLAREGVRLSALSTTGPDLVLSSLPAQLPQGAVSVAATAEHILVGTRETGVARFLEGEARPQSWLRRRPMFVDATTLSVACTAPDNCWIATGSRSAWHWTGSQFTEGGPEDGGEPMVLQVIRDRAGLLYAFHREVGSNSIQMSKIEEAGPWTPMPKIELTTPGTDAEISFARFTSSGALWVGLRYRDELDVRSWGVAVVEIGAGKVQYHHDTDDAEERQKMMPVPMDAMDADMRGGSAWFATRGGVAKLSAGLVQLWDESNGLRSAMTRSIAVTPRAGAVFAATAAGVGRFDGTSWAFPTELGFEVNDLAVTTSGQLWMATGRGIAAFDGERVRRIDTRRGMVENEVKDIVVDRYDRIWARGPGSLTLVSPQGGAW